MLSTLHTGFRTRALSLVGVLCLLSTFYTFSRAICCWVFGLGFFLLLELRLIMRDEDEGYPNRVGWSLLQKMEMKWIRFGINSHIIDCKYCQAD